MKKLFSILAFVALALVMASCSKNTPSAVVDKSFKCMIDKDYEGYVELMLTDGSSVKEEDKAKYEEMKKSMVQLVEEKGSKKIEKNEGIKSYEILSEEIDENGEKAKVTAKIVYGNDTEEEQTIELRKAENGEWLLSTGK